MANTLASIGSNIVKVAGRAIPMYYGLELGDHISNAAHLEPTLHVGIDSVLTLTGLSIGKIYSEELGYLGYVMGGGLDMIIENARKKARKAEKEFYSLIIEGFTKL